MAHRFFVDETLEWQVDAVVSVPLSDADAHHALHVLRLEVGETIEVASTASSRVYRVEVSQRAEGRLRARVLGEMAAPDTEPQVVLVQGVAKGEKMDLVVRQAVEVGCVGMIPLLTERSVVKLDANKREAKAERWRRIARSAAEQAHRRMVPEVVTPIDVDAFLAQVPTFEHVVVLWEDATREPSAQLDDIVAGWGSGSGRVGVVVGPEGGLTAAEVTALGDAGAQVATLGPSVLRTETAAVVGAALLIHELRKASRTQ